jgi:hypothetical protein
MPDLQLISGDSRTLQIAITDEAGAPVDVSTAQAIEYGIFDAIGAARVTKTLGAGITVAAHIVTVELLPEDTDALLGGGYVHELEVITAAGKTHTVLQQTITLRRDYIKRIAP